MGSRYTLEVKCFKCNLINKEVYYAPTCGFMEWKCPKCGTITNLEEYSGIDAIGCANTTYGANYVKELKNVAMQ